MTTFEENIFNDSSGVEGHAVDWQDWESRKLRPQHSCGPGTNPISPSRYQARPAVTFLNERLAQWIEQLPSKEWVESSILSSLINNERVAEWQTLSPAKPFRWRTNTVTRNPVMQVRILPRSPILKGNYDN